MAASQEADRLNELLALDNDRLLSLVFNSGSVDYGVLRDRFDELRVRFNRAVDQFTDALCSSDDVRERYEGRADETALAVAILAALHENLLGIHGINDVLAFSVLILRAGVENVCRERWS